MALVLVVDDDPDIRDLLELKLGVMGHTVATAANGQEGVQACESVLPDLAIFDVMMPKLTGIEAVRVIRKSETVAAMPIILLSAKSSDADIKDGMSAGANAYMTKPCSLRAVGERVNELLENATGRGV